MDRIPRLAWSLGLALTLLLGLSPAAFADWDVVIVITAFHVDKDTDPDFIFSDDPDPYIKIVIAKPQAGHGTGTGSGTSPTVSGQAVCKNPHVGEVFVAPHFDPEAISWYVYDNDGGLRGGDDLMSSGLAGLPGAGPWTVSSSGPSASIEMQISKVPTTCGKNWTYSCRDLPSTATADTTIPVELTTHINELSSPGLVVVEETIPAGFTFDSSTTPPVSITPILEDDAPEGSAPMGTLVRWEFTEPPVGDLPIHYTVRTPKDRELLGGSFANAIEQDGETFLTVYGYNETTIGGLVEDCNGNGVEDLLDIIEDGIPDDNSNGVLDECEVVDEVPLDLVPAERP